MAEQWIDAATANLLILEAHRPPSVAGHAICRRALAGLLKARARLLAVGTIQVKDVEVPPLFWEAEGKEGFDQNWGSGDFSSWNPELTVQSRALGVTFALSGVLEMLPFEQRALTARRLSVVGNPAWVPARVAREFAYKQATVSISGSGTAILDHARLGFVAARAVLAQFFDLGKDLSEPVNKVPSWEEREWDVPSYYWQAFTEEGWSKQDWERGIFDGAGRAPEGPCLMKLEGVHVLAESLQSLLPASAAEGSVVNSQPPGRPPSPRAVARLSIGGMTCGVL